MLDAAIAERSPERTIAYSTRKSQCETPSVRHAPASPQGARVHGSGHIGSRQDSRGILVYFCTQAHPQPWPLDEPRCTQAHDCHLDRTWQSSTMASSTQQSHPSGVQISPHRHAEGFTELVKGARFYPAHPSRTRASHNRQYLAPGRLPRITGRKNIDNLPILNCPQEAVSRELVCR